MSAAPRPRVGISACLLGEPVRYDGGHKLQESMVQDLGRHVTWVPICPEVEMGLGVPREPIHLVDRGGRLSLEGTTSGTDHTERMESCARRRIAQLDLSGYVFKRGSPSCGLEGVPIAGSDPGRGMFAARLTAAFPQLPVAEESALADPASRARFLEGVLGHAAARDRAHEN